MPAPSQASRTASGSRRWARWVLFAALGAAAAVSIVSQWATLEEAFDHLQGLHWATLGWAIYAEALALIAFAQLTRLLLRGGGVRVGLGAMTGLTVASNALATTVPGGAVFAAAFSFGQLRRRGVRSSLSAYALTATWVLSGAALVAIAAVGIELARRGGPVAQLRSIATLGAVIGGLAAVIGVLLLRNGRVRGAISRQLSRICANTRWHRVSATLHAARSELNTSRPSAGAMLRCGAAALLNWLFDCGCLMFAIMAVGGHVPWQGLLAAYGLTQLAAALPITPGGIGVIEGTLSVLLIACHVPAATAIAGVLVYRIISFWILVPLGWGAVAVLMARSRRAEVAPVIAA